jgi:hypothetical protein
MTGKGSFLLLTIAVKLMRIAIIKTTILKSFMLTQSTIYESIFITGCFNSEVVFEDG